MKNTTEVKKKVVRDQQNDKKGSHQKPSEVKTIKKQGGGKKLTKIETSAKEIVRKNQTKAISLIKAGIVRKN